MTRSEAGFELHTEIGIDAAKDYVTSTAGRIPAMILVDRMLRNSRGTDLIRWLHDRPTWGEIPIVVLSGHLRCALLREQRRQLEATNGGWPEISISRTAA